MGASYSSTAIKIVNESIVNVLIKASQDTIAYSEAKQDVNLSGINIGIFTSQKTATSVKALQEVTINQELIEEIVQKIKAEAKAEGVILNPAAAQSDMNIRNVITTNLTNETFQSCVSKIDSVQSVNSSGLNIGIITTQTSKALAECKQISDLSAKIARSIFTDVEAKSTSESKSLFEGLFGSEFMIMLGLALLLIVVIIALTVAVKITKKQKQNQAKTTKNIPINSIPKSFKK